VSSEWQFEWLTDWDRIWSADFQSEWRSWLAESLTGHVFFHPAAVRAWTETYAELCKLAPRFCTARRSDGCVAFLPLVLMESSWRDAWRRALVPVGVDEFDYHDPVLAGAGSPAELRSFWPEFMHEVRAVRAPEQDVIRLDGIRYGVTDDQTRTGLWRPEDVAPYLDLRSAAGIDDVLKGLKRSARGDVRRQHRRLQETGALRLRVFSADDVPAAAAALPEILAEHSRRWPASFKAPGFHDRIVRYCLEDGVLHMSVLELDGEPISWHIGFLFGRRFYWYMPVYRKEYAGHSPGKVHLCLCLEGALEHGATVFDLLRGEEAYKRTWTSQSDALFVLEQWSPGATATAKRAWRDYAKPHLRKLRRNAGGG